MTDTDKVKVITASDLAAHIGDQMDDLLRGRKMLLTRRGKPLAYILPVRTAADGSIEADIPS